MTVVALAVPAAASALPADTPVCADPAEPGPVFHMLRHEERFCERDPTPDDPWWFALKNREVGPAKVSFGGLLRARVEDVRPVDAGLRGGQDDAYVTARALVHADVRFGDRWRAFAQVGYATGGGRAGGPSPLDINRGDVHQAFVDWRRDRTFVRFGRQEAPYGSGRLIGLRDGPNVRQAFDGVRIVVPVASANVELLYLRPVALDPGAWDDTLNHDEWVGGLYVTRHRGASEMSQEFYALRFESAFQGYQNGAGEDRRTVVGTRWFGRLGPVALNSELTWQGGNTGAQSVRAWAFQNDLTWAAQKGSAWSWGVKANAASGDSDPNDGRLETFQPMYAAAPYFMQSALFMPANLANVQPYATWQPTQTLSVTFELQANWRLETADGYYQPPLIVQPLDGRGRHLGNQAGVGVRWVPRQEALIEAWASRLHVAGALERAGAGDTTFFALQATATF